MEFPSAYLASDRRQAMAQNLELPQQAVGAALIADISGFTPLTESLALALGPQRGAEELTRYLDLVYDALIGQVDRYRGAVIGFSGDAITCWFDGDDGRRATAAALGMQRAMSDFAALPMPNGGHVSLALKCGVATGKVLRFVVGDPGIQLIDVIAGSPLDRAAEAEHHASKGQVILDEPTWKALHSYIVIEEYRVDEATHATFAVVTGSTDPVPPTPWSPLTEDALSEAQVRPWILAPIYERLKGQGSFLAELRPVVPLFLRFGTIDFEDAGTAGQQLDAYIRWVQSIIVKYEAALIQLTIGDKGSYLYAVFGAPIAHQNDAVRAVAAAQELRQPPPELSFIYSTQIGISRGRMRAGPYGSHTRRTYGTLGDEVNVAARLMQAAAPGQVLVTHSVAGEAGQTFPFTQLEPIRLKGKANPISAFRLEVAGHHDLHLPEPAYALPMVGRQAELAAITEKLEMAATGKGQILGIAAEAGMGKSRLVAEVVKRATAQGFRVYTGACQSFGTNSAYLVWHEIWESFFEINPSAPPAEQIEILESELTGEDATLAQRLPLLGSVLSLSIPENSLTLSLDSQLRKASLEALLVDWIKARGAERHTPFVFVLEDCHWIDPLSDDLLAAIGRSIQNDRVLLLLTFRPLEATAGQSLAVLEQPHSSIITLNDFTPGEAQRLIELKLSQFGEAEGTFSSALVEQITTRTQGNPFYIEEILNYLRDQRQTLRDLRGIEALGLPDSLHSLILSRIDRLRESQKITIKVASIIGRNFPFRWLWGAYPELGLPEEVKADLAQLSSLDLTPLDVPEPELRYLFKHALTQQVAYESQPFAARTQMHGNLAGYIERIYSDTLDKYLDLLAYQYGHSSDVLKQREYYRRAGIAAEAAYDPETAITYYRKALAVWDAPRDTGDAALRFDVYEGLGRMLVNRAQYDEATETFRTMLEQARQAELPVIESRAWYGLSSAQSSAGDQRAALESAGQAERLAQDAGATRELAAALEMKGRCLFRLGDASAALALGEEMLQLTTEHQARLQMSRSLNLIGAAQHILGRYDAAQAAWEGAFDIARELNDRRQMMSLLNNLGVVAESRGNYREALARYQEALQASREMGHRDGELMFLGNVGEARTRLADYALAEMDLREIIKMEAAAGSRSRAVTYTILAEALLGQGQTALALDAAQEALEMQRRAGDQALLAATWRVLGQIAARLGESLSIPDAETDNTINYSAVECFAESIRICQEWNIEGERARTLHAWANFEIQNGNYDEGVIKWLAAQELFAQLGADFEVARMQQMPNSKLSVSPAKSGADG